MTTTSFMTPPVVALPLRGAERRALLRMPSIGQSHVFVANPTLQRGPPAQALADGLQVLDVVDTLDGEAMTMDLARAIAAEPAACDRVLQARAHWLVAWRDAGVAFARCPHCERFDREWTLVGLAALQGIPRRAVADAQGRLLPFALSFAPPQRAPRPPGVALAARLRFRLPSGANATGVVEPVDATAEALAWQRFAPIGEEADEDHDDWTFESAGFRAVLRTGVALASLGANTRTDITPEDVEDLPLGDFCFLDELQSLAFLTPAMSADPTRCEACGRHFLPLG